MVESIITRSQNEMAKPLRHNVGIALFNLSGKVLLARRIADDGPEIIQPGFEWQMPQGGIQRGEKPLAAALRELFEETGVTKADVLAETDWMTYDFPQYYGPADHRLAKYRGQKQKWFAFRYSGADHEIDVSTVRNGQLPEFDMWRWERLPLLPQFVVPFKRDVYIQVVRVFSSFDR
jgi:putative (di)nucleoside polyphosphate hydrolase